MAYDQNDMYRRRDNRPHDRNYYDRVNRGRDGGRGFFDRASAGLSRMGGEVSDFFDDDDDDDRRRIRSADRYGDDDRSYRRYDRDDRSDGERAGYVTRRAFGDDDDDYGRRATNRAFDRKCDRDHDRHRDHAYYRSWRDRQVASLDRDYDEYRREREEDFHSEFDSWRDRRREQRGHMRRAQAGQEVVDRDGEALGTVERVSDDRLYLSADGDAAGGRRHSVPVRWIDRVDDKVRVDRSRADATAAWRRESGDDWDDSVERDPDATNRAATIR